jgi:putative spermidine/putrescine transport system permease protein
MVQLPELRDAIVVSVELAVLTAALMLLLLLPTMIWVRLRVPWLTRPIEFLCLLPLSIPPLVIVVGIHSTYTWVWYFLDQVTGGHGFGPLSLCFAYVVLVLPYAYRAIDSSLSGVDATTLAEAARSLGASWVTVIFRVITPNIRTGVTSAVFLSIALVLGEYTFAVLMGFQTMPTALVELRDADGGAAMAASLSTILILSLLMVVMAAVGRPRTKKK